MQTEKVSNQTTSIKQLSLTADQMLYVSKILPACFVILPAIKATKQQGSINIQKIKSTKKQDIEDQIGELSRSQKDLEKTSSGLKRQRSKPPVMGVRQQRIVAPRKVKVLEEHVAPELRACFRFLQTMKKHPSSYPFLEPVDPIALGIPTYFDKIKEPMDFGTIETNLGTKTYETQTQFHADIGKVFMNSYRFNAKGSDVYQLTQQVEEFYNKLVENPDAQVPEKSRFVYAEPEIPKKTFPLKRAPESTQSNNSSYKKPISLNNTSINTMTVSQKKNLGESIRRLPRDSLKKVWEIVSSVNSGNEQLKFDLDKLPTPLARELERYVYSQFEPTINKTNAGDTNFKQCLQTSSTYKPKEQVESQDAESFMISQQSD